MNKLDRRAAIGLLGIAAGIIPASAQSIGGTQKSPKMKIHIDAANFESFTVTYKGKTQTYSIDDVMNALFGEGTFGHNEVKDPRIVADYKHHLIAHNVPPAKLRATGADLVEYQEWCRNQRIFFGAPDYSYLGVPIELVKGLL